MKSWGVLAAIFALAMTCHGAHAGEPPAAAKKSIEPPPVRVAVLNFGPTPEQLAKKDVDDLLGATITPEDWRAVVPMLEKDRVDVVVVRVNSGGGTGDVATEFHTVFENEFKPRFRTVAWIDSAVTQAAVAILPIEEFCFMPGGYFGWATSSMWPDDRARRDSAEFKADVELIETGARLGKRSETIARSLILYEPLSLDIDPDTKSVSWRQDEKGQHLVNRAGRVFGMGASESQRFGLSKATAATQVELAHALGLERVEWTGQAAGAFLDAQMRKHFVTMREIDDAWMSLLGHVHQANCATAPKGVKQEAEAAQIHLRTLQRLARDHPAQWTSRGPSPEQLNVQAATIQRLLAWPTAAAALRAVQQPAK